MATNSHRVANSMVSGIIGAIKFIANGKKKIEEFAPKEINGSDLGNIIT